MDAGSEMSIYPTAKMPDQHQDYSLVFLKWSEWCQDLNVKMVDPSGYALYPLPPRTVTLIGSLNIKSKESPGQLRSILTSPNALKRITNVYCGICIAIPGIVGAAPTTSAR